MNLLKETIAELKSAKKSQKDVLWCGSKSFGSFDWATFKKLADESYSCGYGAQHVAKDLLVVGEDWWLERHEYDGSEWWEFKEMPKKPKAKKPTTIVDESKMWENLEEMNP